MNNCTIVTNERLTDVCPNHRTSLDQKVSRQDGRYFKLSHTDDALSVDGLVLSRLTVAFAELGKSVHLLP